MEAAGPTQSTPSARSKKNEGPSSEKRIAALLEWCAEKDVWIDARLEVRQLKRRKDGHEGRDLLSDELGLFARDLIPEQEIVSKTPKSAILSTRSASIPVEAFEAIGDDVDQSLNLSLALLHEQRLGQASHFYGYIQSLPPLGVPLPIFWKQDSLEWKWLEGTECHRRLTRAGQGLMGGMTFNDLGKYVAEVAHPLLRRLSPPGTQPASYEEDLKDFSQAYSIVSSRAFIVDQYYHGLALVPVADLYNHDEMYNVHFESDDMVCPVCGLLDECEHDREEEHAKVQAAIISDASVEPAGPVQPSQANPSSLPTGAESTQMAQSEILAAQVSSTIDTCDIRTVRTLVAGDEALNTYGLLSNAILLERYGYVLDAPTEYERISWDLRSKLGFDELSSAFDVAREQFRETNANARVINFGGTLRSGSVIETTLQICGSLGSCEEKTSFALDYDRQHVSPLSSLQSPPASLLGLKTRPSIDEMSEMFIPLSDHEDSEDQRDPLFVNSDGQTSIPLWRFCLVAAMTMTMPDPALKDAPTPADIWRSLLGYEGALCRSALDSRDSSAEVGGSNPTIVKIALWIVRALCTARKQHLFRPDVDTADIMEEAMRISDDAPLFGAMMHSCQEREALGEAVSLVDNLLEIVDESAE